MSRTKPYASAAILLALLAMSIPARGGAAQYNQFIVFGDSTLDTGYFRYTTSGSAAFDAAMVTAVQQGNSGGFAGNGAMNTTMLAARFGLTANPIDAPGGGTNYANGGATTVLNHDSMVPDNVCTLYQIQNYLTSVGGVANPNGLYLIKSGDNDITYFLGQSASWQAAHPTYLRDGAQELAVAISTLQKAGAKTIVVRNSYDSALFAMSGGDIDPAYANNYAVSLQLGVWEWQYLHAQGVNFIPADNDSLFRFIAHNPTLFGFTTSSVLAANAPYASPHVIACFDQLTPAQQRDYLFIDGVHLTTAGQQIEADYTYSLIAAPSQISLLGESVIQGGWARATSIQGQIEASQKQRGERGVNAWTTVGAYSSRNTNEPGFINDSGAPYGGSVGIDFQAADGLILGAAFSSGSQRQGFSSSGYFDQIDNAASLYAAYAGETYWTDAILTYDSFYDDISRAVPLGIYTDQNEATTSGNSLSFALRGGANMNVGDRIVTGPVVGLHLQQAYVNGFAESSDTNVTALAFYGQTRNSLVSQVGWRALLDLGGFQPFAEMGWNHELGPTHRTITTSLLSSNVAPSYTMDAAPVAADWAVATLGAYYKLSPRAMLRGSTSTMFCNPRTITTGGELGINVAF